MKTSGVRRGGLLCSILVAVMVLSSCLSRGRCQVSVKVIRLTATVKDTSGHPIQGAVIIVTDRNKAIVEDPYLNLYSSGKGGLTNAQVPAVSTNYFVTIRALGYFSPPPQRISGLHYANLKFVMRRNPKDAFVRPVAVPNYNVQTNFFAPSVVQKTNGPVQKNVIVFISPFNDFHRNIHLSVAPLPSGLSATFNPAVVPIKPPDVHSLAAREVRSQLVFHVASTIRPGQYKVDLLSRPTGSHRIRHWPFSLIVLPAAHDTKFKVAQSEAGLEIIAGGQARTVTLALHSGSGFSGPVKLRVQNDPNAPLLDIPTLSQNTLDSNHPISTLTLRLGPHTAEGYHNLLITATASTGTQTLLLPVEVLSYTYGAVPMPTTERPGQPAPPLDEGPEVMIRHDMTGTEKKPIYHRP